MRDWFTIEQIDSDTHIISEYRHWEESHSYLLNGGEYSLLIDTGLGIENISEVVAGLTDKPVIAVATHIHWDHIGGHKYYPNFCAHREEIAWLTGGFPLTMEQVKAYVVEDCDLPEGFDIDRYEFFQGTPTRVLQGGEIIDIGGRAIHVLHTPGHSPGHMCFWEEDRGYLFTGDLVYIGTLFAYYPSTDPTAYLASIERVAALPVGRVFPAHHDLSVEPSILGEMRSAFRELQAGGLLRHGTGTHSYKNFAIWL